MKLIYFIGNRSPSQPSLLYNMTAIDLYYIPGSSPSRAVQMLAQAIDVPLNLKLVNLLSGEQHRPEFLRMNPAHAVPTIDDRGFYLSESRAILTYLVDKYAAGSPLYPAQADRRALINQRLQFDLGTLYKAFSEYYYLQLFFGADADPTLFSGMQSALDIFEKFLGRHAYAAGDTYTIADISLLATVSSFCHEDGVQLDEWPNVSGWLARVREETPGWHWNETGLVDYRKFFAALKAKRAGASAAKAEAVATTPIVEQTTETPETNGVADNVVAEVETEVHQVNPTVEVAEAVVETVNVEESTTVAEASASTTLTPNQVEAVEVAASASVAVEETVAEPVACATIATEEPKQEEAVTVVAAEEKLEEKLDQIKIDTEPALQLETNAAEIIKSSTNEENVVKAN